jgi:lipoprotein-releasing system permease protein
MNSEFYIAKRFSRGGNRSRNIMVRLAAVAVALSMAVMIVAMAVISGFRRQIGDKIAGFGQHIRIVNTYYTDSYENLPVDRNPTLESRLAAMEGVKTAVPFAEKGGVASSRRAMQGIALKGVERDYDWTFFEKYLTEGALPRFTDSVRTKDLLLSARTAGLLELGVGDMTDMLFVGRGHAPRRDRFSICGIYSTGLEEADKVTALTDIRNVQRLNNWEATQITGYEIALKNPGRLDEAETEITMAVEKSAGYGFNHMKVTTVRERYRFLFDWLATHNVNAAVVITIMLVVALINMLAALLVIILERISQIALLKTLGMCNRAVRRLFVYHCGSIILRGMAWGNAIGLSLCLAQRYGRLAKLDEANYFFSEIPVEFGWWIAPLNAGAFAVMVALLALPTMIISRIEPEQSLGFK